MDLDQERSSAHGQKCRSEEHFVVTVGRLWDRLDAGGEGEGADRMGVGLQG